MVHKGQAVYPFYPLGVVLVVHDAERCLFPDIPPTCAKHSIWIGWTGCSGSFYGAGVWCQKRCFRLSDVRGKLLKVE